MLLCDAYLTPETLADALSALAEAPEGSRVLAGATDLLPWARAGRAGDVAGDAKVPAIIDISRIAELGGWEALADGTLRLGATLDIQSFLEDKGLARHLPQMPQCAVWFADDQIRRQATIGGNVVNASPAADTTPPMFTVDAEVECVLLAGGEIKRRRIAIEKFVTGPGRTELAPGEIVSAIYCRSAEGYGGAFEKVGHRRSLVISVVCAAALVKPSADGKTFEDVQLAFGGIAATPVRAREVERFLIGKPMQADIVAEAAQLPVDHVASRSRIEYRRDVVTGFAQRAILSATADAGHAIEPQSETLEVAHG